MNPLQEFKDAVAKEVYGITPQSARDIGLCIACREPAHPKCHTPAGYSEYLISGMCEECFDDLFKEEKEMDDVTAKQMDYEHAPNSQRAIDEAALLGMDVVFPKDDQLQIDIDSAEAYQRYLRMFPLLEQHLGELDDEEHPSKSGGEKRHITITLEKAITDTERILLQACLGSDPVREFLGYIQVLNKDPHPVLFLEARNRGLLGTDEELQMGCDETH